MSVQLDGVNFDLPCAGMGSGILINRISKGNVMSKNNPRTLLRSNGYLIGYITNHGLYSYRAESAISKTSKIFENTIDAHAWLNSLKDSIMISRSDYDVLIENEKALVAFQACGKSWCLGGVRVTGPKNLIHIIRTYFDKKSQKEEV